MGSKGRFPDPFQRQPGMDQRQPGMDQRHLGMDQRHLGMDQRHPGMDQRHPGMDQRRPGMDHGSDPYGLPMHPPPRGGGGFPPMDMMPPPVEVLERKLAAQHGEMQKLATENQRLATTHGTLRQELGAAQHELQMLHSHIGEMKADSEQQKNGLTDSIARMGAELKASEPITGELQKAKAEAQNLISTRQELVVKCQQLDRELQIAHAGVQQIPVLLSELDGLRQEYQHCRAAYDLEKKAYNDHLESLQVMEKNYLAMEGEVEKLRAQLSNASKFDPRAGGAYPGYNENASAGNYSTVQNAYGNSYGYGHGYGSSQGQVGASGGGGGAVDAAATVAAGVTPPLSGAQSATGGPASATLPPPPPARAAAAYDGSAGGPTYDTQRGAPVPGGYAGGPGYDAQRGGAATAAGGGGYDVLRGGPGYDAAPASHWRVGYDGRVVANFDGHGGQPSQYDAQRGAGYEPQRTTRFDVASGGGGGGSGPQGQAAPSHNVGYGSVTPPTHATGAGGYESLARGGGGGGGANVRR